MWLAGWVGGCGRAGGCSSTRWYWRWLLVAAHLARAGFGRWLPAVSRLMRCRPRRVAAGA